MMGSRRAFLSWICHSGMVRRTRPGISRFRVRVFDAPRNDVVTVSDSQRPAAIDDMRDARRKSAFVAREINRERRDLFGSAEPSHRLSGHEHLASAGACGGGAAQHRWRLDRAGADAVTADAL